MNKMAKVKAPKVEVKVEKKVEKKAEKKEVPVQGILSTAKGFKVIFRGKEEIFEGNDAFKSAVKKYKLLKGF